MLVSELLGILTVLQFMDDAGGQLLGISSPGGGSSSHVPDSSPPASGGDADVAIGGGASRG